MIKLAVIEPKGSYELLLQFSDGASGVLDFGEFVESGTEMTEPLRDPAFFGWYFIELGRLPSQTG